MRHLLIVFLILLGVVSALAQVADKPPTSQPANVPTGRQGGDTIDDAIPIPNLIFSDTGTTTGYTDDYDEVCPYDGSTSPDVVYVYHAAPSSRPCDFASIDLCLSSYDTKLYVYDSQMNLINCNDDYHTGSGCWPYSSMIEWAEFLPGQTYYIVVDGYGGEHGEYVIDIAEYTLGLLSCPPGFVDDGEPPLQDEVLDTYNSGCDGNASAPVLLPLPAGTDGTLELCGRQGWTTVNGEVMPDTDWMSLIIGSTGVIEGVISDNLGGIMKIITPGPCDDLQIQQTIQMVTWQEMPFTITGSPGNEVWLQVDTLHEVPFCTEHTPQEWEYWMTLTGLQGTVAVERHSWSEVKALFHR